MGSVKGIGVAVIVAVSAAVNIVAVADFVLNTAVSVDDVVAAVLNVFVSASIFELAPFINMTLFEPYLSCAHQQSETESLSAAQTKAKCRLN